MEKLLYKITKISKDDGWHGYRLTIENCVGYFQSGEPTETGENWVGGTFVLLEPIKVSGTNYDRLILYKVKVAPA